MENYENLTLEQLKVYKASIEEYATISELLEVLKRFHRTAMMQKSVQKMFSQVAELLDIKLLLAKK